MGNTLTGLIPVMYDELDRVAREKIGFAQSVTIDAQASQAALNQTVRSPVAQASFPVAVTPGATVPNSGNQTVVYKDLIINQSIMVPMQWTGEEQKSVGTMFEPIFRNQFSQALRALSNNVENTLAVTAYLGGSRAAGIAGTTPFASVSDVANTAQILDDNGCPDDGDRNFVLGSTAYRALRGLSNLYKVNEAGSAEQLRTGKIDDVYNFGFAMSNGLKVAVAAGSGNTANAQTGQNAGDTVITLTGNASSILAGDVISFGTDANQYVVAAANVAGVITIANPGLQGALTIGANNLVVVKGNSVRNAAFHKSAIVLAARQPLLPAGGDAATDVLALTDPNSGITYQVCEYRVYRQVHYEIGLAYGALAVKPEFIALLLG